MEDCFESHQNRSKKCKTKEFSREEVEANILEVQNELPKLYKNS